jgi:hypothetical protein
MFQFAQATTQAIANEPERIGMSKMTKQHRNELAPTGKASCMSLGFCLFDQSSKFGAGKMTKKLIKQTGGLYHVHTLPFFGLFRIRLSRIRCDQQIIGGHFPFSGLIPEN